MPVRAEQTDRFSRWLLWLRLAAAPLAGVYVFFRDEGAPAGHREAAFILCALLAVEAVALLVLRARPLPPAARTRVDTIALIADFTILSAFLLVLDYQSGHPARALVFFVVLEGALRFGTRGGLAVAGLSIPVLVGAEAWQSGPFDTGFEPASIVLRGGLAVLTGAIVGGLADGLIAELARTKERTAEAELLRDELGRRVDLLEAANRCARALGSSLELDHAFSAFIRELRGLVPFDRAAIVLAEDGRARVMAAAGEGVDEVFPPGTSRPVTGSVLEEVLAGRSVYRKDMADRRHPEEDELLALGLRCRLVAPLLLGARAIGMMSLVRREADSFTPEEQELVRLLGRLVATGVQNIRAYEAERQTVEELRRLSALRADFVSLVSHELRSPMAAVIGSARTLQQRWRQLSPEQRDSFLALIADETNRLATLVGDVLDTSRIEAGTFSFVFEPVDFADLVEESVAHAGLTQDEVEVHAAVQRPIPAVRGDRERLRQVLANLIDNAVKYSHAGDSVDVTAHAENGRVEVTVVDRGPGIPADQHRLIFEKFGRARGGGAVKPGTGLGLFIARSIAEAHGGSLDVESAPGRGAAFTLALPLESGD